MNKKNITSNMSEYRKDYRIKNPDKFVTEVRCEVCSGKYQICSKHQHLKTDLHKNGVLIKKLKDENIELKDELSKYKKKITLT